MQFIKDNHLRLFQRFKKGRLNSETLQKWGRKMSFVRHIFNRELLDQVTTKDVQRLIDNETEESLHLDFEGIPIRVQYDGLAKHVSGFLNTSGGIVVFGVSETRKNGRHVPSKITWTTIEKETLENNLYQRIDPWCEEIQICSIQDPSDSSQRIFAIFVPKSEHPPHMANFTYYIRLNFQTRPIGHEQVSTIFRQYYLQKYDLVNSVYSPIYSELTSYLNQKKIKEWKIEKYEQICKERLFLLSQDDDLRLELDGFYQRVCKWNKAVHHAPFRLARIINDSAKKFFDKTLSSPSSHSAIKLEIKAESTHQFPYIDEAILNKEDPIGFWKDNYPFDRISEITIHLEYLLGVGQVKTEIIEEDHFKEFLKKLKKEVQKDEMIQYIWKEFEEMQSCIEILLNGLESRM